MRDSLTISLYFIQIVRQCNGFKVEFAHNDLRLGESEKCTHVHTAQTYHFTNILIVRRNSDCVSEVLLIFVTNIRQVLKQLNIVWNEEGKRSSRGEGRGVLAVSDYCGRPVISTCDAHPASVPSLLSQ